jgi:hypothetical protein
MTGAHPAAGSADVTGRPASLMNVSGGGWLRSILRRPAFTASRSPTGSLPLTALGSASPVGALIASSSTPGPSQGGPV